MCMVIFLTVFFLLYGLLHFYVFARARAAFHFSLFRGSLLAALMAVMIVAPVMVRLLENRGLDAGARIAACAGYTWMGVVFLMVSSLIVTDVYGLIVLAARAWLPPSISPPRLGGRTGFLLAFLATALISLYGLGEAGAIRTNKVVIRTSKPLPVKNPVRIVQISDVHLGLIVRHERLSRIVDMIREAQPDILVSTGDLVDGQMAAMSSLRDLLLTGTAGYGKFAVTGNHEFYAGIRQALAFTGDAGFRVLHREAVEAAGIVVAGVDDPAGPGFSMSETSSLKDLLSTIAPDRFVVLLKHRPVFNGEERGLFDLQLSGHLHGGQIFPFRLVTRLFFRHYQGLYSFGNFDLFVSRGSGTWGPPIRFLSSPEVTLIEIVHVSPEAGK